MLRQLALAATSMRVFSLWWKAMALLVIGDLIVLRALLLATPALAIAIWGAIISAVPVVMADPIEFNCTQFNEDGSCYWANCTQAKANGECNIREGSPHYCAKQDRDGDGLACEC